MLCEQGEQEIASLGLQYLGEAGEAIGEVGEYFGDVGEAIWGAECMMSIDLCVRRN